MHTNTKKLGAISGLPRSGSTLLCNILAQNPRIHTTPTSGLADLLYAARNKYSASKECQAQELGTMDTAWLGFCRGAIHGWADALTDRPVYLDKSRIYHAFVPWWKAVDADFKIIVVVRDLRSIVASLERRYQTDRYRADPAEDVRNGAMLTLESRVAHWMQGPTVRIPLTRLQDLLETGQADDTDTIHFVVYEELFHDPQVTMDGIYAFLGEDSYVHDFTNIAQYTQENDSGYGLYGRHTIRPELAIGAPGTRWETAIPAALLDKIHDENVWFYDKFYRKV